MVALPNKYRIARNSIGKNTMIFFQIPTAHILMGQPTNQARKHPSRSLKKMAILAGIGLGTIIFLIGTVIGWVAH
jgi:hypothetical protein